MEMAPANEKMRVAGALRNLLVQPKSNAASPPRRMTERPPQKRPQSHKSTNCKITAAGQKATTMSSSAAEGPSLGVRVSLPPGTLAAQRERELTRRQQQQQQQQQRAQEKLSQDALDDNDDKNDEKEEEKKREGE